MSSDLKPNWPWIVKLFEKSLPASHFYTFATIGPDGTPHTAPYASLVLNQDCTGYYSDCFPNQLSYNLNKDQRICIMAVRLGFWYWIKALVSGRFEGWPGVRLYGSVDKLRKARPGEIDRWRKKVNRYKYFKGYDLLWKDVESIQLTPASVKSAVISICRIIPGPIESVVRIQSAVD